MNFQTVHSSQVIDHNSQLELTRPLFRPTFHNYFRLSEKFYRMLVLAMEDAKKTLLPTTEREESHWRRHADINADVASLNLVAEFASGRATAGEETSHIAVIATIHQFDGIVDGLNMHETKHWAENFHLSNFTGGIDFCQYCRPDEVAIFIAKDGWATAVYEETSPFISPFLN